jgi:hypothetical protein
MSLTFRSKSASNVKVKDVVLQKVEVRAQYVITFGNPLLKNIEGLKYIDFGDNDTSIICGALAVVLCSNVYDSKINNIVCFAREYGVPLIWLGLKRPPESKLFNFALATDDMGLAWRYLCQIK